ncbi:Amino-acid acetyltransferase, mitochondrial [Pichia californica]|uniref:Amino-acid acetyltransferase, mitochondrial n=1 Tax=Pichia californica TaxID=460514 RepID=A0A9P7BHD1_9ASCO|nr:Amino-acid acetyltransferase, mitochondrial [[Candida] californica]KAG0690350.1 Amino-acid acetyltransferase, mitochondrial [[Candida] californica]
MKASFSFTKRFQSIFTLKATDFDDESNLLKHSKLSSEKQELILTILNSTATKREARSYLSKYRLLEENDIYKNKDKIMDDDSDTSIIDKSVENSQYSEYIGKVLDDDIFLNNKDKTVFKSQITPHVIHQKKLNEVSNEIKLTQTIRCCILRIRKLHKWDADIIKALGMVLKKAMSLGASPLIIIDGDIINGYQGEKIEKNIENYVDMKLDDFMKNLNFSALSCRVVKGCFDITDDNELRTFIPEMIGVPIFSGIIPIISPFAVKDGIFQSVRGFPLIKTTISCLEDLDMKEILSVEKVVFIGEAGGFPSIERSEGSHVLINLLQEYKDIKNELSKELDLNLVEREEHLSNLEEMKYLLDRSPSITGILTTPEMAAREEEKQVGKETNPIIYNILTDRPTISSSLPVSLRRTPQVNTTIVKNGISISVFQSKIPEDGLDLIELNRNGSIDLTKLKDLIDSSFGRDLNMDHYLNRINKKVAGLIIAGDYEGGAIITWEDIGNRSVAYLDKFAVIKKLQGIPGIADVVFKAMLKSFEDELLWRSRKNNPVNKWYFERSKANYSIDGTQWKLFYTGSKELTIENLKGYIKVCGSIEPSFDIK